MTEVKQVDICIFVASVSLAHGNLDFEMPVRPSIGNTRVSLKIYEYGVQRESRTEYKICSEKKKRSVLNWERTLEAVIMDEVTQEIRSIGKRGGLRLESDVFSLVPLKGLSC